MKKLKPCLCLYLRTFAAPARAREHQRQPRLLPPKSMPHTVAAVLLLVLVAVSLLVRVVVVQRRHRILLLCELPLT